MSKQLKQFHIDVKKAPEKPKNNLLPTTTKKMVYKKKKQQKKQRIARSPFPASRLVKMKSIHQFTLDPNTSAATAILSLNPNNPLDPYNSTDSVSVTLNSPNEHHPKHFDQLENVYERFSVLGYKVRFRVLYNNISQNFAMAVCATNSSHTAEVKNILGDTLTFASRLKEAVKNSKVVYRSSGTGNISGSQVLTHKSSIKKLLTAEEITDGSNICKTGASDTEAGPTADPRLYLALGAIGNSATDLADFDVIVEMEQIVLFTGLPDLEGATV